MGHAYRMRYLPGHAWFFYLVVHILHVAIVGCNIFDKVLYE